MTILKVVSISAPWTGGALQEFDDAWSIARCLRWVCDALLEEFVESLSTPIETSACGQMSNRAVQRLSAVSLSIVSKERDFD